MLNILYCNYYQYYFLIFLPTGFLEVLQVRLGLASQREMVVTTFIC